VSGGGEVSYVLVVGGDDGGDVVSRTDGRNFVVAWRRCMQVVVKS